MLDVVHRAGINHKPANAWWRIPTTGDVCNPVDDLLLAMMVSSQKRERKGRLKHKDVFNDCYNNGATATHLGLPTVCPITTLKAKPTTPTVTELVTNWAKEAFCNQMEGMVGTYGSGYSYDLHCILVRSFTLSSGKQTVLPRSLWAGLLYLAFHPKQVGHPGERLMYDTMRREVYRPAMAYDDYTAVGDGCDCTINRAGLKRKLYLILLPSTGPLGFVITDILGPLSRTTTGNQFIAMIANRYTKWTGELPSSKATVPQVLSFFFDSCVITYGTSGFLLTDNGPKFMSKLLDTARFLV